VPRYEPTAEEQAAIDRLTLAGYAVVRQRTYDDLKERVVLAEARQQFSEEDAAHARHWAEDQCDEQRRLADRLNEVCSAATSLGVPIDAINEALGRTRPASTKAAIRDALSSVRSAVMSHEEREGPGTPYMVRSDDAQHEFVAALGRLNEE
jgi:hypothetical protein